MDLTNFENMHRASELFRTPKTETRWLIEKRIPYGSLTALVGESGVGKSTYLRQLAIAIASDSKSFLGDKLSPIHKKVMYVSTEDGKSFTREALTKQLQIPEDAFDEYGILIEEDERLRNMTFIFDNENIIDMLRIQLSIEDYDLIIVDAYSDIFVGDMNQSNQVRKFLTDYGLLAGEYDCAILFMHHFGKGIKTSDKHRILGSSGFEQKMRSVLSLSNNDGNVHLQTIKNNYLDPKEAQMVYHLDMSDDLIFKVVDSFQKNETYTSSKNTKVYRLINEYPKHLKHLKSGTFSYEIVRRQLENDFDFKVSAGTLKKAVDQFQEE